MAQIVVDCPPFQLEALLAQLTNPDSQQIKQAEEILTAYLKNIHSVAGLMTLIAGSANPSVRQMAAVVLKKKVIKHWSIIDTTTQATVKQALLLRLVSEHVHVVRGSLATLVSTIYDHDADSWPELMIFIQHEAASVDKSHREISMTLLHLLGESLGKKLQQYFYFCNLPELFATALQDPESLKVRVFSMRAACSLMASLDEADLRQYQSLLDRMVEVLHQCMLHGAESELVELLDALVDIVNNPFLRFRQSIDNLVQTLLQVFTCPSFENSTRASVANAICELIECKPKAVAKEGLVPKIFTTMLNSIAMDDRAMCGHILENLAHDSSESGEETPGQLAQQTLDALSLNVPAKYVNDIAFSMCIKYMQSPEPTKRKAGVFALGILSEGCKAYMCQNIDTLLPLLFVTARDSDKRVYGASCFALGQFAKFLNSAVAEHLSDMLPLAIGMIDDETETIQATALYVVEEISQIMDSRELRAFLDTLVSKLLNLLRTSTTQIQKMVLGALTSVSIGAEAEFVPYLTTSIELIRPFFTVEDPTSFFLLGAAMECIGYFAVAVGAEAFRPYFLPSMQFVVSSFKYEDVALKEQAFTLASNLSSVYKAEFQPFLQPVATFLLAEIESDDGTEFIDDDDENADDFEMRDEDDKGDDGNEDDIKRGAEHQGSFPTTALTAKVRAIAVVEKMTLSCGAIFEPYIPRFVAALTRQAKYLHRDGRGAVAAALAGLAICSFEVAHPNSTDAQVWLKGDLSKGLHSGSGCFVLEQVVKVLIDELIQDPEECVVAKALTALQALSMRIGPTVTLNSLSKITTTIRNILCYNHDCQAVVEFDDHEEDAEGGVVFEAATNLLGQLSRCYGLSFLETFRLLFPNVLRFTNRLRTDGDRAAVVRCFAEVLREIGPAGLAYVKQVYPVVIPFLASEDNVLLANSAFCIGILVEISGSNFVGYYEQIVSALLPLLDESNADLVRDNAAVAVARMIMTNANKVPLELVLPVFVRLLPLKSDENESPVVFKCLNGLVEARDPVIMGVIPQVIEAYAKSFMDEAATSEAKQAADSKVVVRSLLTEFHAQTQSVISQLSPELRKALASALDGNTERRVKRRTISTRALLPSKPKRQRRRNADEMDDSD